MEFGLEKRIQATIEDLRMEILDIEEDGPLAEIARDPNKLQMLIIGLTDKKEIPPVSQLISLWAALGDEGQLKMELRINRASKASPNISLSDPIGAKDLRHEDLGSGSGRWTLPAKND